MGRGATKAIGNVWFEARKHAAMYDDRLSSREGAAERLGMSVSAIQDAELGLSKCMPVDKAVLMADLYNAPELLNHYCLNECPIGCKRHLSDSVEGIDRVTVKLLKSMKLENIESIKERLIDIAEDGQVTSDELDELNEISKFFNRISEVASELEVICKKANGRSLKNGGRAMEN